MKIAVSSRLFGECPLLEGIALARDYGYTGVELWYEDLLSMSDRTLASTTELGLTYYLHAASRDINFLSVNPRIASVSLGEVLRSVDIAERLAAQAVVVHPARMASTKDSPEEYWDTLVSALGCLVQHAQSKGVHLAVENMELRPKELLVFPEDMLRLIGAFPDGELGICLDLAHAATINAVERFLEPELWNRTTHIHLSNSADGRTHVPLWQGHCHASPRFQQAFRSFTGPVVIEGYDHACDVTSLLHHNREQLKVWGLW